MVKSIVHSVCAPVNPQSWTIWLPSLLAFFSSPLILEQSWDSLHFIPLQQWGQLHCWWVQQSKFESFRALEGSAHCVPQSANCNTHSRVISELPSLTSGRKMHWPALQGTVHKPPTFFLSPIATNIRKRHAVSLMGWFKQKRSWLN
jgi:hypothetical protein